MLKKLFSPLFFIFSIILFGIIFYKSEIIFSAVNREYYYKYYIFCFILIFLSICTFYINDKIKEFLLIIFLPIIFSFYLFEYYLGTSLSVSKEELSKIKLEERKKNIYESKEGVIWDNRTQYQVYADLLKINPKTVPYFYPTELNIDNKKIHSLAGVSNSQTVFCNENGYFSIINSDRYGFNNPDKEWDSKEFEFVFVGDSFTHGYCVNRPNDIPSVIRKMSGRPTLNLGYGKNGPLIEYATLKEFLPKKTKNIIFIYFGGNDLDNLAEELNNEILIKYLNDYDFNQNLKSLQNKIDKQIRTFISSRAQGLKLKYQFIKLRKTRTMLKNLISNKKKKKIKTKEVLDQLKNILILTKKLSIKNQSKLFFVYIHSPSYWTADNAPKDDNFEDVKFIVEKLEINFLDIHESVVKKKSNPLELLPLGIKGHFNVKGYSEIAEAIYENILINSN